MRTEAVVLGLFSAAASTIAFLSWRTKRTIARRLARLAEQCEKAESDKASLARTLSLHESEENERISRLEHDLKSPLGVILGFSSMLRESIEQNPDQLPALPLKSINAIQKAAQKILTTIDAAVEGKCSHRDQEEAVVEGKN
jgi:signal transduction histidine kinase